MDSHSPLVICVRCCSLQIEGPAFPADHDIMRCRHCGNEVAYGVMRGQIRLALTDASGQVRARTVRRAARYPKRSSAL
jgi:hypothetical protein